MAADQPLTLLEKVQDAQTRLIAFSTGGTLSDWDYKEFRKELLDSAISDRLPAFLKTCRSTEQFWAFIKAQMGRYQERREFLWEAFRPALEFLERHEPPPSDSSVDQVLAQFSPEHVHEVWRRALERREADAEGAITLARNLLETVCKHILEDLRTPYPEAVKLPQLYRLTAKALNLAPSQHSEDIFRQILGGCESVVGGLAGLRNQLSDSHGQGRARVRPKPRHAQLAVNLAGSMATFLIETWRDRPTA